jgi:hypothetical protein
MIRKSVHIFFISECMYVSCRKSKIDNNDDSLIKV